MGAADDHRVDLRHAASRDLLCVQAVYGGWVDGWGGEELIDGDQQFEAGAATDVSLWPFCNI